MGELNYQEGWLAQVNTVHLKKMASGFQAAFLMSAAFGEVSEGVTVIQLEPSCLLFSSLFKISESNCIF